MGKEMGRSSRKTPKEPYGYLVDSGYYGWVQWYHGFMLFATEEEYREYIEQ